MSNPEQRLYSLLPVKLQDLATTVYGIGLYMRRYGSEGRAWLSQLLASQRWPLERLRELQLDRVRAIVDAACLHVPHYREAYREAGYRPGDLKSLEDLSGLPIIEKEQVRRSPTSFVDERIRPSRLVHGHTSGSTGTPLSTYKTRASYQRNWAFQERVRSWFGIPHRSPRASFGMRQVVPRGADRPPFWRTDGFTRNCLFSIFHMTRDHMPAYIDQLARLGPVEINGLPSALTLVARACLDLGRSDVRPRVVITSGETLLDAQRELIERAFGCKVRDQYGSAENVVWVSQCEHGAYHEHLEYGFLEVLRGSDPVSDGRPGEVVATGFINPAMPLIRYRLGDSLSRSFRSGCPCGRAFPVVEELVGRTDDVLHRPDGTPVPRLGYVFKSLLRVKEAQVIQEDLYRLRVVFAADGDPAGDLENVRASLCVAFGPGVELRFERVEAVPRTPSGKLIFQRNEVDRARLPTRTS